jgi:hypothetical protein
MKSLAPTVCRATVTRADAGAEQKPPSFRSPAVLPSDQGEIRYNRRALATITADGPWKDGPPNADREVFSFGLDARTRSKAHGS